MRTYDQAAAQRVSARAEKVLWAQMQKLPVHPEARERKHAGKTCLNG